MTEDKNVKYAKDAPFKVFIKPQSVSDCFIVTMDPKYPFKICLYPSIQSGMGKNKDSDRNEPDELEQLVFHNYLTLRRNIQIYK